MDNLSAVFHKTFDLRLEDRPIPEPGDDEVVVEMDSVGICGSDIHFYTYGTIGDFVVKTPLVLGHEGSGTVVKCGSKVTHLSPGDKVAIEPGVPCRLCKECKTGRYNLCSEMVFKACPPYNGSLCRYFNHAGDFCFKLPQNMTLEEGALMEPLAVAVHACQRAGVSRGKSVLVCGAGPIGLLNLLTAKAFGASEILVTDISENRLQIAKTLGATHTYLVTDGKTNRAYAEEIVSLFKDCQKPDITIECSGAESSISTGIYATRSGGVLVLVGLGPSVNGTIPIVTAGRREIDVKGIFRYANCYPMAIHLVSTGLIDVKPLITHRFKLEDSVMAFETARTGAGGAVKVMIKCRKE